jgi:hypothetical protein
LRWFDDAVRAQKHGANSCGDGAGSNGGATSVTATLRRPGAMVGSTGSVVRKPYDLMQLQMMQLFGAFIQGIARR